MCFYHLVETLVTIIQAAPKPTPVVPEMYRDLIDAFIECPPEDKIRRLNILSMIASHFKEDEALELLPGLKKHVYRKASVITVG